MNNNKINKFTEIPINYDWSFSDKTIKDTAYITHGYYTYPAKFIPQLVKKIIKEHSEIGNIIVDPFMGSGTTIIEAIVNERIGIGVDINEIAVLIAKVKSTPIDYNLLLDEYQQLIFKLNYKLNGEFKNELIKAKSKIILNDRVDYWFKPHTKDILLVILHNVLEIDNIDVRDFFLVSFAQILKSCSIWLQKSVKPTRDFNKKEIDPLEKFEWQTKKMIKKHNDFNDILTKNIKFNINRYRILKNNDSRNIPCDNEKVDLIITSPPYVTSYEYADLHQLPSLWFGYLDEISSFRKKFIGSSFRKRIKKDLKSNIAKSIIKQLGNNKKAREVENYFVDMLESFIEMKRVLKKGGKAAIIIGNTKLKAVEILNAEVFKEQFENIGMNLYDIIQREIPSKMLPSTRDSITGRFTKANNSSNTLVYPTEYILIIQKI